VNSIMGYEAQAEGDHSLVTIGAGEVWDQIVEKSVEGSLSGIEALSLIPGKAGATPIQNVGAYGQEISQTLVSLKAFDREIMDFVVINNQDCDFAYRTSRFKTNDRGRFFISSITLRLTSAQMEPPFYPVLAAYLESHQITDYTPLSIRQAVIDIRSSKLPDPSKVHNNGSFFGNPIISEAQFAELAKTYPDLPHWPADGGRVKLSAAWLMEGVGFKDFHDEATGMGTWPKQSLVLVNEHANSTSDLLKFKQKIVSSVEGKFGVSLTQEPELLP
jgi:UDP-N-acetylmuramate dehydrogenase